MIKPLDYFTALVRQDNSIPLFEAAVSIAQDADPEIDLVAVQAEVDTLATRLRRRLPADAGPVQKVQLLNQYFYRELGFGGNLNNYYDPDNSYLHRVLKTRRGIPISLAVLYAEMAQQIGLDMQGISFPGHFLMKLSIPSGDIILDPINGASLSRTELEERLEPFIEQIRRAGKPLAAYLDAAPSRDVLVRMLRNLKSLFLDQERWQKLLDVQQRLLILLPSDITERRDRGLAFSHLECPQAALEDFQAYLAQRPYAADAEELRSKLSILKLASRKLN